MVEALIRAQFAERRQARQRGRTASGLASVLAVMALVGFVSVAGAVVGARDSAAVAALMASDAAGLAALAVLIGVADRMFASRVTRLRTFPVHALQVWSSLCVRDALSFRSVLPLGLVLVFLVRAWTVPSAFTWTCVGGCLFVMTVIQLGAAASAMASATWADFRGRKAQMLHVGCGLVVLSQGTALVGWSIFGGGLRFWLPGATSLAFSWPAEQDSSSLIRIASSVTLCVGLALAHFARTRNLLTLAAAAVSKPAVRRIRSSYGHLPWSAIATRSTRYAVTRFRMVVAVSVVVVLAIVIWLALRAELPWLAVSALAMGIGLSPHNSIERDGLAFSQHPMAGVTGASERIGRTVPPAAMGLVATFVIAFLMAFASGEPVRWVWLSALGVMLLGVSLSVSAVSSILFPYPVGDEEQDVMREVGIQLIAVTAVALLAFPAAVVLSTMPQDSPDPVATAFVIGYGLIVLIGGITVGAQIYDRRYLRRLRRIIDGR